VAVSFLLSSNWRERTFQLGSALIKKASSLAFVGLYPSFLSFFLRDQKRGEKIKKQGRGEKEF
jgi:hypothetical protein